jgi:hypothetical protein
MRPDDPRLWPTIVRNLRRSQLLMPAGAPRYPRGLHRFRSRDEADRARAAWEADCTAAGARRFSS